MSTRESELYFDITSICKDDLRSHFSTPINNNPKALARIETMTTEEMRELAEYMAEDYCEQMYWSSMGILFEDHFLKEEK